MFNTFFSYIKKIDKSAFKIMKNGIFSCCTICLIATIILITYLLFFHSQFTYYLGITLFKLGLIFNIEFIVCAFVSDFIKNQISL